MSPSVTSGPVLPRRWICLVWLGLGFSTALLGVIGAIVRGDPMGIAPRLGLSDGAILAIVLYVAGSVLAVGILGRNLRRAGLTWAAVGIRGRLSPGSVLWAIGAVAAGAGLYAVIDRAGSAWGLPMYWSGSARSGHVRIEHFLDAVLIFGFAVLLGPLMEEILFRGYLLSMLRSQGMRAGRALALSALVFTTVHAYFGPGTLLFIFLWSFLPAGLYLRFGSLYPAVLFHAGNNLVAYVLVPLFSNRSGP